MAILDSNKYCSQPNCNDPIYAKGLCRLHCHRLYKGVQMDLPKRGDRIKFLKDAISSNTDECSLWPYFTNQDGYGRFQLPGTNKKIFAHVYVLQHLDDSKSYPEWEASHLCKNSRACVNPRHLLWETHQENIERMHEHGTILRGSQRANAKLSESKVLGIYSNPRPYKEIALTYNVSRNVVSIIKNGWTWSHLTGHVRAS